MGMEIDTVCELNRFAVQGVPRAYTAACGDAAEVRAYTAACGDAAEVRAYTAACGDAAEVRAHF
jgi:hypothetical protein